MAQLTSSSSSRLHQELASFYALAPINEFPKRVLALVHNLIGCDVASYNNIDISTGQFQVLVDPEDSVDDKIASAFDRVVHEHPVIAHYGATGDPRAHTISDFLRQAEFRRLDLYGEFFGPLGINDQLSTSVPTPRADWVLGVALNRSDSFTEQDRMILDILRPHFAIAYQNAILYSHALESIDTEGPFTAAAATALDHLTDRQREVLRLVTQGYTNYRIAAELGIREGTVKKHMEHLLGRLHVQTRVAAARIYLTAPVQRENGQWWNIEGNAGRHPFSVKA